MELSTEALSEYAMAFGDTPVPPQVRESAKRLLLDSIGCCFGGYTSPPSKILRRIYGSTAPAGDGARVIGTHDRVPTENAALINSAMVRYLDFNDTYINEGGACHPSDHIPALLAVAENEGASGNEFLRAIVLAYELECAGVDTGLFWENGFDYTTWGTISSTASVGVLMGLSRSELAHALGIAGASSVALGASRLGDVSMWKGVAHSYVNHNAIQACTMAREGLTGPTDLFDETGGVFESLTDEPIVFDSLGGRDSNSYRLSKSNVKRFACGYYMQSSVTAARELVEDHDIEPSAIDAIDVDTFAQAAAVLASPEKWDADLTRETADHSIPYTLAVAVISGDVTPAQYTERYLRSEAVHDLMQKVSVRENEDLTAYSQTNADSIPSIVRITVDGATYETQVDYPLGHAENPMSDEQLERKMESLADPYLSDQQLEQVKSDCYAIDEIEDVGAVIETLAV